MPFDGEVIVKPILPAGTRWELINTFKYTGNEDTFEVPAGFTTDFASVPRVFVWLLPRYGQWTQAAVLHDYLWDRAEAGEMSKFDADGIFNRALRELGVPYLRRWVMWTAVRWAAGPWTWLSKGPVPFLKMLVISVPTLAFLLVPTLVILVALLIGAVAELLAYLPLRLFHRTKRKRVNAPDARDLILS